MTRAPWIDLPDTGRADVGRGVGEMDLPGR